MATEQLLTAPVQRAKPTVRRRHPLRWVAALVIVSLLAWLFGALAGARIVWPDVATFLADPLIIKAAWNTVLLAVVSQVVAVLLGVLIAVLRISENPVARTVSWGYIWVFRGVPVLLQILLWYNLALVFDRVSIGFPGAGYLIDAPTNSVMTPFVAALLGLALNESAYMAEIIRGGIKSVDSGQVEAATALAMPPGRTMRRVILPQAMRVIIPPTGNDFINMLKTTSLASVITYPELLRAAQNISANNLEVMESLFAAAFWYMVIVSLTSTGQYFLERSFDASVTHKEPLRIGAVARKVLALPMNRRSA